jgi:uncharacterized glyoxalase superfamily protein PhnB
MGWTTGRTSSKDAIEFYRKAFGAKEVMRFADSSGKIGHAEIRIGDSPIILADEFPETGFRSPQSPPAERRSGRCRINSRATALAP